MYGGKDFELPANHKPFMKITSPGSSCANCKYISADKKTCGNKLFVQWYGKNELPQPATNYCSDWWEPRGIRRPEK